MRSRSILRERRGWPANAPRARHQARFEQHLRAVAHTENELPFLRRFDDVIHHWIVCRNGAGANAVFICKTARQHECIVLRQRLGLTPMHHLRIQTDVAANPPRFDLAVRARKYEHRDLGSHYGYTSASGALQTSCSSRKSKCASPTSNDVPVCVVPMRIRSMFSEAIASSACGWAVSIMKPQFSPKYDSRSPTTPFVQLQAAVSRTPIGALSSVENAIAQSAASSPPLPMLREARTNSPSAAARKNAISLAVQL